MPAVGCGGRSVQSPAQTPAPDHLWGWTGSTAPAPRVAAEIAGEREAAKTVEGEGERCEGVSAEGGTVRVGDEGVRCEDV